MAEPAPCVYLLAGDDEQALAQAVSQLEHKIGDPGMASLNTTRLDGAVSTLEQVWGAAAAAPFLAARRLVIVDHPLARAKDAPGRQKLIELLEKIPPTTALALVIDHLLTLEKDRRNNRLHWLETYALAHRDRVLLRTFPLPRGREMVARLQELAKAQGGQIAPQAAELLGALVDGDTRLAAQEIDKLLAYVNYARPIQVDDVQELTADVGQGDVFALVDALSTRSQRQAMEMLERMLEYKDYYELFGMIARQFRLLLLAREALDLGGGLAEVQQAVGGSKFVAGKIFPQARNLSTQQVELGFRRLLEMEQAVKTSQLTGRLALETFVVSFTGP